MREQRFIATVAKGLAILILVLGSGRRANPDPQHRPEHDHPFEVWAVDQSGTAGTLYIFDGEALNESAATAVPEVIDLGTTVTPLCAARTGSAPLRGHMMMFSPGKTHAILAYVASGHVVFLDAETRTPLECIDVGLQAHAAFPSPDGSYVAVANQNGKLLQRIRTDYATNTFTLEAAATLDLATCVTPSGAPCQDPVLRPDTAPICPVIDSSSRLVFTTLRGGGLFVVDGTSTPMRILAEYDQATVRANGCGGIEQAGRMYINADGGTAGNPTENDLYSFALSAFHRKAPAPPNWPAPRPSTSSTPATMTATAPSSTARRTAVISGWRTASPTRSWWWTRAPTGSSTSSAWPERRAPTPRRTSWTSPPAAATRT